MPRPTGCRIAMSTPRSSKRWRPTWRGSAPGYPSVSAVIDGSYSPSGAEYQPISTFETPRLRHGSSSQSRISSLSRKKTWTLASTMSCCSGTTARKGKSLTSFLSSGLPEYDESVRRAVVHVNLDPAGALTAAELASAVASLQADGFDVVANDLAGFPPSERQ